MRIRMLESVMHSDRARGVVLPIAPQRVIEIDDATARGWIARGLAVQVAPTEPLTRNEWGEDGVHRHVDLEAGLGWPLGRPEV
jgi:hypothetical protein